MNYVTEFYGFYKIVPFFCEEEVYSPAAAACSIWIIKASWITRLNLSETVWKASAILTYFTTLKGK
jgi:hypothetical protein